ncbi:YktB family protein [Pseudalkalibacillus hwajinpoensis]|uniref:UPF0637 protein FBF83_03115 n=1 Tax=Guptibacillus hwajinpoensis TaxID=208199 RepID=A0A4U1MMA7_9BACL|nr:DUF1054 domain-containing protein [Pseudalkalibacillus hwajinpoensis]TKD71806.1 DUF1054 domain-containing protein [Pseudalkalibacillus hwajinpoensis]
MSFNGFTHTDFETFQIEGLESRMEAIQNRIQPKFTEISKEVQSDLEILTGNEMHLHIAKHLRRTKNPPVDTWMAFSHNNRGYKMLPHFQIGLFDDHVFIWLAYIYELPGKQEMATLFLNNLEELHKQIPSSYMISTDHTKKGASEAVKDANLEKVLTRFRDVKKGEFLVGRHIASNDPILKDGEKFIAAVKETFETVMPIYKLSLTDDK